MRIRACGVAVLVAIAVAPAVRAQDFGVMAGATFSKFGGSQASTFDKTRVGVTGGLFANFRLGDHLGLQPEALFVMKGSKTPEGAFAFAIKLNYVEVPLLLKLNVSGSSQVRPHF